MDEVTVHVEIDGAIFSDKMSQMQDLRDRIGREIASVTGVRMRVDLAEPNSLERFTGKAKRVQDKRGS